MLTELDAIKSARFQYRTMFKSMARGNEWHMYRGATNVLLLPGKPSETMQILVRNVQGLSENTMVNALSNSIKKGL